MSYTNTQQKSWSNKRQHIIKQNAFLANNCMKFPQKFWKEDISATCCTLHNPKFSRFQDWSRYLKVY